MNNRDYLTPLEIAEETVEIGYTKANKSSLSLLLGILAGAVIVPIFYYLIFLKEPKRELIKQEEY